MSLKNSSSSLSDLGKLLGSLQQGKNTTGPKASANQPVDPLHPFTARKKRRAAPAAPSQDFQALPRKPLQEPAARKTEKSGSRRFAVFPGRPVPAAAKKTPGLRPSAHAVRQPERSKKDSGGPAAAERRQPAEGGEKQSAQRSDEPLDLAPSLALLSRGKRQETGKSAPGKGKRPPASGGRPAAPEKKDSPGAEMARAPVGPVELAPGLPVSQRGEEIVRAIEEN